MATQLFMFIYGELVYILFFLLFASSFPIIPLQFITDADPLSQQFQHMILEQQLLSTQSKELSSKPKHEKPRLKTYRELLRLDRPRKDLYMQEEENDDDFLQKLLQKEMMDQKKKKAKKKAKKKNKKDKGKEKRTQKVKETLETSHRNQHQFGDVLENVSNLRSHQRQQEFHEQQKQVILFQSEEMPPMNKDQYQNQIYLCESNENLTLFNINKAKIKEIPFLPTNALPQINHSRSNRGFKLLLENKQKRSLSNDNGRTQLFPILNPEKKKIEHIILESNNSTNSKKKIKCFVDPNLMKYDPHRIVNREKLFRSKDEEVLFLESIRKCKGIRGSLMSLAEFSE